MLPFPALDDALLDLWADRTAGRSGADLEALVREAGLGALREALASGRADVAPVAVTVTPVHLEHALGSLATAR